MKKFFILLVILLLAGAAVCFCLNRGDSDKARDVLPAEATAAMMIEPEELVSELGISVKDMLKLVSVFGDAEGTIDLKKPVYGFTTESGVSGFSLNVEDAGKLLKLAEGYGFASEEQDGLQWLSNKNFIACLDKDKMLVCNAMLPEQDGLRNKMAELMKQSRKDVPALERARENEGVVRSSTALSQLPKQMGVSLPGGIDLTNAFLNTAIRIEKQALVFAARVEGAEDLSMPLAPIKGDLKGMSEEEPFAWVCVNMKGEELLPHLRKVPELRNALLALNMCVDADMMIKAIDGDVMLALPELDVNQPVPGILFTATVGNTDFMKNADDWKQVTRRGASDFLISNGGTNVFFGVRDGKLYLSNSEKLADNPGRSAGALAAYKAAGGKYLSARLNLKQLYKAVTKSPSPMSIVLNMPQIREVVDALECVSLNADSQQSIELKLETNKPVKDIYNKAISLLTGK